MAMEAGGAAVSTREPTLVRAGGFDAQVCVPADWTDEQVLTFAERAYPSGTLAGWRIRREGDPALGGSPERNPCEVREGFVHITVDA